MSRVRNSFMKGGALVAALLLLSGCASGPSVTPTGNTTEVTVTVDGMRFVPDVVEVPVGDELVITFENTGTEVHDLTLENGKSSARLMPDETEVIDAGIIAEDLDGWCSVSNHRAMGMELTVRAVG
ncbi:cupredoxin domain-containing protein [Microbacterium suwonense]|nr:cupredoxin domain-containing protein [Microbacterium suwonense]